MKTDTELEALLRATLNTRAAEVTEASPVGRVTELRRPTRRWLPALIAASVVLAVAIAVTVATGGRGGRTHPPIGPSPSATTTTVSPPPRQHVTRQVSLSSFRVEPLPGWTVHLRASGPGYRLVTVRKNSDQDAPIGCNGCEMATAYVYVFDRGEFVPQRHPVHNAQQIDVSGKQALLGTAAWYGEPKYQVPTVAWQFAPGEWALVQGVTPAGGVPEALLAVARAVVPGTAAPLGVPFTLGYAPNLPVTNVIDDHIEGNAFTIAFGSITSREFDMTLWPGNGTGEVARTPANRRLIGGLPGYYDRAAGVADIPLPHGYLELGISEGNTDLDSLSLTETDRMDMDRVLDELRWTNGDGSEPYVPAERAIP